MERQKLFEKIFKEHIKVETSSREIESLYGLRSLNKIDYSPYYQRNYVWDNHKATYFIESILLGTEIPPLIFFNNNDGIEVIDGRQRFETIYRFIRNEFSLTKKGLNALTQLKGSTFDSLLKSEPQIIENFYEAKLRLIEFRLVNEPPLDKVLEDQVKKEIFSRYNSGITPLKKAEIDNAIYDNDELSNRFKSKLENDEKLKLTTYKTFFRLLKKDSNNPPIENILTFIRRFLVLPLFPIKYYARGTSRTDILSKLYEYFADENSDNEKKILEDFEKKVYFMSRVKEISDDKEYHVNRLALECFLWGLGILDQEEIEYKMDDDFAQKISDFINDNIADYTEVDYAFSSEVITRYSATAKCLQEIFESDLSIYIYSDKESKERIDDAKKPDDATTKLSELEDLRLNKPDAARNTIEDILNKLNRRKFNIRPSYQRKEVINPKKASSIIESILLGIALPSIFVFKRKDGINEVIDGQQRLLTILGFIGAQYVNEKGNLTYSKNHEFALRNLRILHELDGKKFKDLNESLQNKIYDFLLYVVEIDEKQNNLFNPVDLFIRLNDKPYPIRENSFEMWNSWADIDIIKEIKSLRSKLSPWFYLKRLKKSTDRDRMENEELLMSLAYIEYSKIINASYNSLDVYQKSDRVNARISTKARISNIMQEINSSEETKKNFIKALKKIKGFTKNVKYVLLDKNKTKDDLAEYLSQELSELFRAKKEHRYFKRTIQDFYFLWMFLESINFEMVKFHRLEMKASLQEAFSYFKNIPEADWENNKGLDEFNRLLKDFKERYKKDERKISLSEKEKLKMINEQNNVSSISGAPIFLGDDIEVDHIEPLAIGGADEKGNLGIAHDIENRSKGANKE